MKIPSRTSLVPNVNLIASCQLTALVILAGSLHAQQLTPVWQHLVTDPASPLPILRDRTVDSETFRADEFDGSFAMDSLAGLKRFDANRLLLGIRENGIIESDPNLSAEERAWAEFYPDRSLVWINPTNGAPMGLALVVGLHPVALDSDFHGSPDQYWWSFDVSEDGYIYTGYKNKLLRYGPDGMGGIDPNPRIVYTHPSASAHGNWQSWSWPKIRVRGSGANTVILAGGNTSASGNLRLSTSDGQSFQAGSWLASGAQGGGGGGASSLIPSRDPGASANVEWVFAASYPGNDKGAATSFYRFSAQPPFHDPEQNFVLSPGFNAQGDPAAESIRYRAQFIGDVDAHPDLDYVVAYSAPSWNSGLVVGAPRPGWLALHDIRTGGFISSHQLEVTEEDELLPDDLAALYQSTIGYVTIYKPETGPTEVLWASPIYGYGRYTISGSSLNPARITRVSLTEGKVTVTWKGDARGYQLQRSATLAPASWSNVGEAVSGDGSNGTAIDAQPFPGKGFYRVVTLF